MRRDLLCACLDAGLDKPLTLVSAPPGFGKTTLIADWLAKSGRPAAWLSLDRSDSDLASFVADLAIAARTLAPNACSRTLAMIQASPLPPADVLADAFSNDLEELADGLDASYPRPVILALDDYHLVESQDVDGFLARLLEHPPSLLHLVICTRKDPALPLGRLRANDRIADFRAHDLRFSTAEVAAFMRDALDKPLTDSQIAILAERTDGWAVGLRLVALSLSASDNVEQDIIALDGDNRQIVDYLLSEVLVQLPAATQEFLLKTAVLDRLSGPLCAAVTGLDGAQAQATLEWLYQANLFTTALDAQARWYRYHHLFQKSLLTRQAQLYSPEQTAALHARAGAWYAANGFYDEAIAHVVRAGDESALIALVQVARHDALNHERWRQLERWLALFPRQTIDSQPTLVLLEAGLAVAQNRVSHIAARLRRAEELLQAMPPPDPLAGQLLGEMDVHRASLAFYALDPERGLKYAQRALAAVPLEMSFLRGYARAWQAGALLLMGDIMSALACLSEGLEEGRHHGSTTYRTRLLLALAVVYWWTADLSNFALTGQQLQAIGEEHGLLESAVRGRYYQGMAAYQRNDLGAAEAHFLAVIQQPHLAYPVVFVQCGIGLSSVYQAQGRADQATRITGEVTGYALKIGHAEVLADIRAFAAHLAVAQGRIAEAGVWAANQDTRVRRGPLFQLRDAGITLAEVLLAEGTSASLERAAILLPELLGLVEEIHSTRFLVDVLALRALLHDARGERDAALADLARAMTLAQPGGLVRVFADLGPKMAALIRALRAASAASGASVAPGFLDRVLAAYPAPEGAPPSPVQSGLIEPLSSRELEVLGLLARRLSDKEIAQTLFISPLTVKRHTANIYQKLAVANRREAIVRATALGLLVPVGLPPQP